MKRSGPPYDAAIWFVIITGTIGTIVHLTMLNCHKPFCGGAQNGQTRCYD